MKTGGKKPLGSTFFDRHYVVSLIDGIVERLGMMVYDGCVLVPEKGETLYTNYDQYKLAAENLISSDVSDRAAGGTPESIAAEASGTDEPEYRLLSDALRWFDGKDEPDDMTVMNFMKQVFFYVVQGLDTIDHRKNKILLENSNLLASDIGMYLIDVWRDALALPEEKRSSSDFNSIPLKHLLMDVGGKGTKTRPDKLQNDGLWVAAVSESQLSLNMLDPDFQFRLETRVNGYEQSGFIFVFSDNSTILDTILPTGFHFENSNYGQFAWNLDASVKIIEDSLMIIGRNLFN